MFCANSPNSRRNTKPKNWSGLKTGDLFTRSLQAFSSYTITLRKLNFPISGVNSRDDCINKFFFPQSLGTAAFHNDNVTTTLGQDAWMQPLLYI